MTLQADPESLGDGVPGLASCSGQREFRYSHVEVTGTRTCQLVWHEAMRMGRAYGDVFLLAIVIMIVMAIYSSYI